MELAQLVNLELLDLADNGQEGGGLTGVIPPELGALPNLDRFNVIGNSLEGCIPPGLAWIRIPVWAEGNPDLRRCPTLHDAESARATCSNGTVIPSPDREPGLLADCIALLVARDVLAGDAAIPHWTAVRPITDWRGVVLDGSPQRVTGLYLPYRGLRGAIPAELGQLSELRTLDLSSNDLTGEIPLALAALPNLQELDLAYNELEGCIPPELERFVSAGSERDNPALEHCPE